MRTAGLLHSSGSSSSGVQVTDRLPGLVDVPNSRPTQELVVKGLFGILVSHPTQTGGGQASRTETAMPVDAELSGAVTARGVIADQPALVIACRLIMDASFDLGDDGEGR